MTLRWLLEFGLYIMRLYNKSLLWIIGREVILLYFSLHRRKQSLRHSKIRVWSDNDYHWFGTMLFVSHDITSYLNGIDLEQLCFSIRWLTNVDSRLNHVHNRSFDLSPHFWSRVTRDTSLTVVSIIISFISRHDHALSRTFFHFLWFFLMI